MNIIVRGFSVAKRLLFQREKKVEVSPADCPALKALDEAKKMAETKPSIRIWKVTIEEE